MELEMHMDEYLPLRDVVFNTLRAAILKGELKPGERLMEIALADKLGVSRTPIREAIRKLELEMHMDEYLPLRDVVFNTLRAAILKGELKPGERLMEIALADKLGVSRTPIREAIRKLELEGLVVMAPRKGAKVASITERDLNDVLEVRKGMEVLAVSLACQRITKEELDKLEEIEGRFQAQIEAGNLTELAEIDVEFHDTIYKATNNQRLVQLLNNLREQMYRYRVEYLKDIAVRRTLAEEHRSICEALRAGDETKALDFIRVHIDNQQKAIIRGLNQEIDSPQE